MPARSVGAGIVFGVRIQLTTLADMGMGPRTTHSTTSSLYLHEQGETRETV